MTYGGDDRHWHGSDGAGDPLAVERPEVFDRSSAAGDNQNIHRQSGDAIERRAHGSLGFGSLDLRRDDDQLGNRPAAADDRLDVAQRGAIRTRDDGDAAREWRQTAFARRIEQAV